MTTKTNTATPSRRKKFEGIAVSSKMQDTVVVLVERYVRHPKYRKAMRKRKKFKVHDAGNTVQEGQRVRFEECAPISKDKRFQIIATK